MNITVLIKDVYGLRTIYPVCQTAKLFANIAGTKTLTMNTLRDIRAMGYEVIPTVEQPELAL